MGRLFRLFRSVRHARILRALAYRRDAKKSDAAVDVRELEQRVYGPRAKVVELPERLPYDMRGGR